jgi:hypothetical protein
MIPTTKQEWWDLVRKDLAKWNEEVHSEDRMGIQDWIGEVGPKIHGWIAFRDRYGDWDVSLSGFPEDDDEEYY